MRTFDIVTDLKCSKILQTKHFTEVKKFKSTDFKNDFKKISKSKKKKLVVCCRVTPF